MAIHEAKLSITLDVSHREDEAEERQEAERFKDQMLRHLEHSNLFLHPHYHARYQYNQNGYTTFVYEFDVLEMGGRKSRKPGQNSHVKLISNGNRGRSGKDDQDQNK